jgi:hypothetical protein
MILSAQSTGTHSTNSGNWQAIPGLTLKIPEGVQDTVLAILNVPNPYATGNDFPGGTFGIALDNNVQAATATFTYDSQVPQSSGRRPTTLVVALPLGPKPQSVQAMWQSVRNSNVVIDSPATLSVII